MDQTTTSDIWQTQNPIIVKLLSDLRRYRQGQMSKIVDDVPGEMFSGHVYFPRLPVVLFSLVLGKKEQPVIEENKRDQKTSRPERRPRFLTFALVGIFSGLIVVLLLLGFGFARYRLSLSGPSISTYNQSSIIVPQLKPQALELPEITAKSFIAL